MSDIQHVTDAAAERCTSEISRDEAEEWCRFNGVIICTVEERDERGKESPDLFAARQALFTQGQQLAERDARIAELDRRQEADGILFDEMYAELVRLRRLTRFIARIESEHQPNAGLLTVAQSDARMGSG